MNLKTYLRELGTDEARLEFARRCGTSVAYLRMIAYNAKRCGEALAMTIDQMTEGAVTVEELRPDLSANWQYLRASTRSAA